MFAISGNSIVSRVHYNKLLRFDCICGLYVCVCVRACVCTWGLDLIHALALSAL